ESYCDGWVGGRLLPPVASRRCCDLDVLVEYRRIGIGSQGGARGAARVDSLSNRCRDGAGVEVSVAAGVGGGDGVAADGQGAGGEGGGIGRGVREGAGADGNATVEEGDGAGGVSDRLAARAVYCHCGGVNDRLAEERR